MAKTLGYLQKERNVIVRSEFAKEHFSSLHEYMVSHIALNQSDVENSESQELRTTFDKRTIEYIFAECKKEWRSTGRVEIRPKRDRQCEICAAKIQNVFFIENTLNGTEMGVGSECAGYYGIDKKELKNIKERALERERAAQKIARREELLKLSGGALSNIEGKQHLLSGLRVVPPQKMIDEFNAVLDDLNTASSSFIGRGSKLDLNRFQEDYSKFIRIIAEISEYDQHHKNDNWVLTRQLERGIRSGYADKEQVLRTSGFIDYTTLCIISDDEFCRTSATQLAPKIRKIGFKIEYVYSAQNIIQVAYTVSSISYELVFQYTQFMDAYGILLFDESAKVMAAIDFIRRSSVEVSTHDYNKAIKLIQSYLPEDMSIDGDEFDSEIYLKFGDGTYKTFIGKIIIKRLFANALNGEHEPIAAWARGMKTGKRKSVADLKRLQNDKQRGYVTTREYF